MEFDSEVASASKVAEIDNQIIENTSGRKDGETNSTPELVLQLLESENQPKADECDEVIKKETFVLSNKVISAEFEADMHDMDNVLVMQTTAEIALPEGKIIDDEMSQDITAENIKFPVDDFVISEYVSDSDPATGIALSENKSDGEIQTPENVKFEADDVDIQEIVSDNDPAAEIALPEKKSDSQDITAKNIKFPADDFVINENVSDSDPATGIALPENKSDGEIQTPENVKFEADDVDIQEIVSDNDPAAEIALPEKTSDSQDITAKNIKFPADDFVINENVSDSDPATVIALPENKSDGEIQTPENVKFEADDVDIQEIVSDNDPAAEIALPEKTSDSQDITAKNIKFPADDFVINENVSDSDPATGIALPENKSDGEIQTPENVKFEADDVDIQEIVSDNDPIMLLTEVVRTVELTGNESDCENLDENTVFTSSPDEMTDQSEYDDEILFEEEIYFTDDLHVENDEGEETLGCGALKDENLKKTENDAELGEINKSVVDETKVTDVILTNLNDSKFASGDVRIFASTDEQCGEFCSDQQLRRKGYSLHTSKGVRTLTNLSLYSSKIDLNKYQVRCSGLPDQIMENHLIPLFEEAGKVYRLQGIMKNEGRVISFANVTYTTEEDAVRAVKILNSREVQGRSIVVEKCNTRIFVKGILRTATKRELFDEFSNLSKGLKNVILYSKNARKNRGFCILNYVDYRSAWNAKEIISQTKSFGRQLISNWAEERMGFPNATTLHISNIGLTLKTSDLRKLFSVYGEVRDIDKIGTSVDVVFRNAEDASAAREINKKWLGGGNVMISQKVKFLRKQIDK